MFFLCLINNTCIPWLGAWKYFEFVPISIWQDLEFAFECALCILLHLLDGDKLYASESSQQRNVLNQRLG